MAPHTVNHFDEKSRKNERDGKAGSQSFNPEIEMGLARKYGVCPSPPFISTDRPSVHLDIYPQLAKMPNDRSRRRGQGGGIGWTVLLFLSLISSVVFGFAPSHQTKPKLLRATDNADATNEFISKTSEAVVDQSFVSFTLRGPKAPRKRKGKKSATADYDALAAEKERLRGCVKTVHGRLIALQEKKKRNKKGKGGKESDQEEQIYMQATTKYHGATDLAQNWLVSSSPSSDKSFNGDEVEKGLQQIFFPDMSAMGSEWGASPLSDPDLGIRMAELVTTDGTHELNLSLKKPKLKFIKSKTQKEGDNSKNQIASHDRNKKVPLLPSEPFLQRLGVSDKDGKPKKGMASKLRQCQKFCEIVGRLVDTTLTSLPSSGQITTISSADMGCGRGYLTFSLHSFLTKKYSDQYNVQSRGIEVRPKLVSETNQIAKELGSDFDGLRFAEGTIENVVLGSKDETNNGESVDQTLSILIALHACDMATDDALWSGVREGADVIVTAPCCHKEVRRQLDPFLATAKDHPLADVLRHNIYRERVAETVTDSLRALLLEIAHYSVQVFEFIGGEHSAKNVMITATKCRKPRSESELKQLRKRFRELAALHGVKKQRLATWMGESISEGDVEKRQPLLSTKKMPPLAIDPFE